MEETYVLVRVTHRKPIPDLTDFVAGRAYTLDGVTDVDARILKGGEWLSPVVDRGAWYGGPALETKSV